MKQLLLLALSSVCLSLLAVDDERSVPMCNGRDLAGSTNINCAPETWTAKDGAFGLKDTGAAVEFGNAHVRKL